MRRHNVWMGLAVLLAVAGLTATSLLAGAMAEDDDHDSLNAFRRSSAEIASTLQLDIQHEQDLVFNAAAFMAAHPDASNAEFVSWTRSVQALQRYPEVEGIGRVVIVPAAQLSRFAAQIEADPPHPLGPSGRFQVVPPGSRPFYCFSSASRSRAEEGVPAGLDFCAVSVSSLRARDSGVGSYEPFAAGGTTWLGVETPIYRGGMVPATVEARRAQFLGWLGISVAPWVVLDRALKGHPDTAITMTYHHGPSSAVFHRGSVPGTAVRTVTTDLHNGWTVQTAGVHRGAGVFRNRSALIVLIAGLALSVSLSALVLVLATSRRRALALVDRQTRELRHQSEQIERSERWYRSLVQGSSDLTLVCDDRGRLTYVSPSSLRVTGTGVAALLGTPVTALAAAWDLSALAEWLHHLGTEERTLTCQINHADGQPRWVEVTATDLRHDPAVGGIVLNLRDITDRRRLETELRRAQRLETIGQLAGGIAQEIDTPIRSVWDKLRFLHHTFADLGRGSHVPAELTESLAVIERVTTIVRAMRVLGHQGTDEVSAVDLNEAVRTTLVVANGEMRQVAEVRTDLGELPPVQCHLDDITQVLLTLLMNAAHAVGAAKDANGSPGLITVHTRTEAGHVILEVAVSGIRAAGKELPAGWNQGLSLAQALIRDRNAGSMTFADRPGGGTTVSVRLPVHAPDRSPEAMPAS